MPDLPNDYLVEDQFSSRQRVCRYEIRLPWIPTTNWAEMSESERNSFMERCFGMTTSFAAAGIFWAEKHSSRPGMQSSVRYTEAGKWSTPMAPTPRPRSRLAEFCSWKRET